MKSIIPPLILAFVFLFIWELYVTTADQQFLFSKPSLIFRSLLSSTLSGELPKHSLITGSEALLGFLIGVMTGTISGFLLWYFPLLRVSVQPFLFVLGVIPVIAFAPLVLIWFGIGFSMKVALACLATYLISLSQAFSGANQLKDADLKLLRILGASRSQILFKAVVPMSLSWVFQSMKLNVGFALLGAFVGEFISADKGIGFFMIRAGSLYDISAVFAGAVYIAILGLVFHGIIVCIERSGSTLIRWVAIAPEARRAL
jgi:NitT/TauT family transport system permease protein